MNEPSKSINGTLQIDKANIMTHVNDKLQERILGFKIVTFSEHFFSVVDVVADGMELFGQVHLVIGIAASHGVVTSVPAMLAATAGPGLGPVATAAAPAVTLSLHHFLKQKI